jgi:NAD(P)-dependent dehydrogenase (short-subunit alcohol dehydrogenase family)
MAERSSDKRLLGRRALVTGAAGGQGSAVARQFAAEGAVLALTDLPGERLSALELELRCDGANAKAIAADVRSEQEVQAVVAGAVDFLGGLDVLYNNAGVYWAEKDATVDLLDRAIWDEILAINATSAFLFSKHALPHLLESRDGVLLNVASVAGYAGDAECHAYAASKGALIALTKSIAQRFGSSGLRANVICPGFIATPMVASLLEEEEISQWVERATALGRVGQPEEVAAVAAFLASSASSFVTASVITVHGGLVK